jgi:hypothetical protein
LKSLAIYHAIFAGNKTRGCYRSMSASLGGDPILIDTANPQVVAFIEQAIEEVINRAIASGEQSISINIVFRPSITLSDNLKAYIIAKYEADPIVDSIIFDV